jgi:glucosamine-6-phosphate deaminase
MSQKLTVREHIPVRVFPVAHDAAQAVAEAIADLIRTRQSQGRTAVLGLATGSSPVGVYEALIRMHQQEGLSFANVITFNLDEYVPMHPQALQSYHRFMHEHLFRHIDIPAAQIHIPRGDLKPEAIAEFCAQYEAQIAAAGGIDIQLLGIGRTGHVGFNEPGSDRDSTTRLITLDRITRLDAASDFFGVEHVPPNAITMGVGTIMAARRVFLLAFGEHKAAIIARAVEGPIHAEVAASYLQQHPNACIMVDEAAGADLTRLRCPWTLGPVAWDTRLENKAVIWLAGQVGKAILKLTNEDYNLHGLQELLANRGGAYAINLEVFRRLQRTITGWPGGKPKSAKQPGDIDRPADAIFPKRCVIFSPHPDDDVISMGGTLIRLAQQGHEVHIAYQTSGNIAVFDHDVLRQADFAAECAGVFGFDAQKAQAVRTAIHHSLLSKPPGAIDSPEVQQIKAMIRRGEARAGARVCGVPADRLHFLDLPFYQTGLVRKNPLGEEDVNIVVALLEQLQPHQIYAAGDLSDPHGTHRVCLAAIFAALERLKGAAWLKSCQVWLYRGAWQEWEPERIDMAVPLSPDERMLKRQAIFRHQSQKDSALFPGTDTREFWQRAEDRNRATAELYDKLGLAEYDAIEAFALYQPSVRV